MTRSDAEDFLLDAGWLGIMFRELSEKEVFRAARKEMVSGHVEAKRLRDALSEIQAEVGSSTRAWKIATDTLKGKPDAD